MSKPKTSVHLEFSDKYNRLQAEVYLEKHRENWSRRLSHSRDVQLVRKSLDLAGNPKLILDLPCGTGRFWPVLRERSVRELIAADNSQDMLDVAATAYPDLIDGGVRLLKTSAFAIELPDCSVDCVFCMRLMHHIGLSDDRLAVLKEFHRVTRDSVILSLWVDGNFKAWRRKRLERTRCPEARHSYQNRFVITAQQAESEFCAAGFDIAGHYDFLPGYSMWRVYILKKKQ